MKRLVLIGLAVAMAVAAGAGVIFVPRHERIDIGRPLGTMYIKVSDGIVFERRSIRAPATSGSYRPGSRQI